LRDLPPPPPSLFPRPSQWCFTVQPVGSLSKNKGLSRLADSQTLRRKIRVRSPREPQRQDERIRILIFLVRLRRGNCLRASEPAICWGAKHWRFHHKSRHSNRVYRKYVSTTFYPFERERLFTGLESDSGFRLNVENSELFRRLLRVPKFQNPSPKRPLEIWRFPRVRASFSRDASFLIKTHRFRQL